MLVLQIRMGIQHQHHLNTEIFLEFGREAGSGEEKKNSGYWFPKYKQVMSDTTINKLFTPISAWLEHTMSYRGVYFYLNSCVDDLT